MSPENPVQTRMLGAGRVLGKGGLIGTAILAVIVIPLTLWYAWSRNNSVAQTLAETAFCISMVWFLISTLRWTRSFGKLNGSSSAQLLLGPFPADPNEQVAWRWGRHCRYAFFAMILSIGAFALVLWLRGE